MTFDATIRGWFETARERSTVVAKRARRTFLKAETWQKCAMGAAALFIVALVVPMVLAFALAALVLALLVLWIREFVTLMRAPATAFPTRFDRWIWIALILGVPPIGLLAFWTFRHAHWPAGIAPSANQVKKPAGSWDDVGLY